MAWGSDGGGALPPWTDADTELWHTCRILEECASGALQPIPTVYPLGPDELAIAESGFRADEFAAAGDGSYQRSGMIAVGRPAFMAGALLVNAASNAAARRRAQADAQACWRPAFEGGLVVTTHGFVLHTQTGVHRWDWGSIDFVQLEGRGMLVVQGRSELGPVSWRLHTWCAELLLCLWAVTRHPQHPQFAGAAWLPPGWIEHARAHGYGPPLGGLPPG